MAALGTYTTRTGNEADRQADRQTKCLTETGQQNHYAYNRISRLNDSGKKT